ncbi:phasin family protein [Aliiroseovarius sp. S1339]|uniref:phasin family protein n=1 Tax=Aliiroseovarius sp. S1339 TaxID=2936990 RepID=UPI0020BECF52|nr:phasin family protein [Aliiroseovarius sp. S1339]MCK8465517.1 phasin family protein [Aliiroseovarius sp. S1339]
MAQSKPDISAVPDILKQAQSLMAANPLMGAQMTNVLEAQQRFLKEAQEYSDHWFSRRKEATETAIEAANEIVGAGPSDPAAMLEVMSDWQKHSTERIAADFQEWVDMCSRCTGQTGESDKKGKH